MNPEIQKFRINQGTIFLIKGIFCIIITIIRETTNSKAVTSGMDIIGLRKEGDNEILIKKAERYRIQALKPVIYCIKPKFSNKFSYQINHILE